MASAESPRYVAAVRRHGYRMAAPVTRLAPVLGQSDKLPAPRPDDMPQPSPLAAPPVANGAATDLPSPSGRGSWGRIAAVLGLALLLAASGLWWSHEHPRARVAAGSEPRPVPAALPRSSVAVMPFSNLTGEPAKDYLGDGMAEELINTLAQVPGLKFPHALPRSPTRDATSTSGGSPRIWARRQSWKAVCAAPASACVSARAWWMPPAAFKSGRRTTTDSPRTSSSCRTIWPGRSCRHCAGT